MPPSQSQAFSTPRRIPVIASPHSNGSNDSRPRSATPSPVRSKKMAVIPCIRNGIIVTLALALVFQTIRLEKLAYIASQSNCDTNGIISGNQHQDVLQFMEPTSPTREPTKLRQAKVLPEKTSPDPDDVPAKIVSSETDLESSKVEQQVSTDISPIDAKYQSLLDANIPFYVYDDKDIDQPGSYTDHDTILDYTNLKPDAETDIHIIETMKAHPMRTMNPEEATIFFIPLSTVAVKARYGNGAAEYAVYKKAIDALQASPWFQRHQGNDHVIVNTWCCQFEHRMFGIKKFREDAFNPFYDIMWNVTVADGKDRLGIEELYQGNKHPDFQEWFAKERFQTSRSVFAIGNVPLPKLGLIESTYEQFQAKPYFLFYRIRPTEYFTPHSTEFRRAPLEESVVKGLPESSMGYDLPKEEWMKHFSSSKFCLVVRGDDPNSHSLLRSVKVGCIPVVVSDAFPLYMPALKSSIDMHDYCIFLEESKFMEDPLRELKKLEALGEDEIKDKLKALSWAQRIIMPDHPQSLFVPAFLREALEAKKLARPETTLQKYEDTAMNRKVKKKSRQARKITF